MIKFQLFFDIVKWHRPERVLRQFGLMQGIPPTASIDIDLHCLDRRGRVQHDWRLHHQHYVALWDARGDHIATAEPIASDMDYHAPYMTWYRRITRRFITPMDDVGPMRYQTTASSAHLLVCNILILLTYCLLYLFQQIITYHFI